MSAVTEIQGVPRTFGRLVNHDERSRAFAIATDNVRIRAVDWRRPGVPVLDQGQTGSCTGNATVGCVNTLRAVAGRTDFLDEAAAVAVYSLATRLDGLPGEYPPEDTGSDGNSAAKAARTKGYLTSWRHAFGIQQLLIALQSGPVSVGTVWLDGMNEPGAGAVIRAAGSEEGGHQYKVDAFDPVTDRLAICNSWGAGWGDGGRAWIDVEDMDALLRAQGDVTVPVL